MTTTGAVARGDGARPVRSPAPRGRPARRDAGRRGRQPASPSRPTTRWPSRPRAWPVATEAVDLELLLPRWRRPSLLQARKADPIRDATPAPRLTFDEGLVGPLAGRERRVIRYRVVRLLDSPDELRGTEIGYLDQGDEVQLLEKYGAYWLVLAPTASRAGSTR